MVTEKYHVHNDLVDILDVHARRRAVGHLYCRLDCVCLKIQSIRLFKFPPDQPRVVFSKGDGEWDQFHSLQGEILAYCLDPRFSFVAQQLLIIRFACRILDPNWVCGMGPDTATLYSRLCYPVSFHTDPGLSYMSDSATNSTTKQPVAQTVSTAQESGRLLIWQSEGCRKNLPSRDPWQDPRMPIGLQAPQPDPGCR